MKRFVYILLCLCLLTSAVACGDAVEESSTPAPQTSDTDATTTIGSSAEGVDATTTTTNATVSGTEGHLATNDTTVPTRGDEPTSTTRPVLSNDETLDFGDEDPVTTTQGNGKPTVGTTTQPTVRPNSTTTTTTTTTTTEKAEVTTTTAPAAPALQVTLPENGYKLDSTGRISLQSASVSGTTVTFVMQNTSGTWLSGEDSTLAYTVYGKNGQVLTSGSLHIGMIRCRKTANITLTLPADAARVAFGTFSVEYWSDWKK